MRHVVQAIDRCGGLAARWQLRSCGVSSDAIDVAAYYGRWVIRVRKGWYARADENRDVIRACRVGGRLTCVSAIAFHEGSVSPPTLHVEVPANSPRLRDPDRRRQALGPESPVVVHWTRYPGPGDARAVTAAHAEAVASRCGVHGAGVPRSTPQAAASSESASRIV
ncbi:MAG TPA: hypothetical protein VGM38_04160 [Pseudolysinimonas sp.]